MDGFKCEQCNLKIEKKDDDSYSYAKPGIAVPTKLADSNVIVQAYKTGVCPLCGFEMNKL